MQSTLRNPVFVANDTISKTTKIVFWIFTALFCLEMSFTAYYELLPQGAQAFTRLGFSNSLFRWELSLAKLIGVAVLLIPAGSAQKFIHTMKEWAYAGFAINLVSAFLAHLSIHDRRMAFIPSALTSLLWAGSYFYSHRVQSSVESGLRLSARERSPIS